ncbi:MAG: hypothetical protein K2G58_03635 [Alistipes sp.]|nr:hypothetical protein [Alistipes sp.]
MVESQIYKYRHGVAYDTVYRIRGVYTSRERAEKVAQSYNTCMTTGHVTEVELNKEYDNL